MTNEEVNWDELEYHPELDDEGCIGEVDNGNWEWAQLEGELVGKRKKRKQGE